jgi:hypothetical protein
MYGRLVTCRRLKIGLQASPDMSIFNGRQDAILPHNSAVHLEPSTTLQNFLPPFFL